MIFFLTLQNREVGSFVQTYASDHSSFFKTYQRKNLEYFIWPRASHFDNLRLCLQKLDFPSLKKRTHFQGAKVIFCSKIFSNKIGRTKFSFLKNGSNNSSEYQRINFNEFHDKIIAANNFTSKNILERKIGFLRPQRGQLPWATEKRRSGKQNRSGAQPVGRRGDDAATETTLQSTRRFSVNNNGIKLIFAWRYSPDLSASYGYRHQVKMFEYCVE